MIRDNNMASGGLKLHESQIDITNSKKLLMPHGKDHLHTLCYPQLNSAQTLKSTAHLHHDPSIARTNMCNSIL